MCNFHVTEGANLIFYISLVKALMLDKAWGACMDHIYRWHFEPQLHAILQKKMPRLHVDINDYM